MFTRGGDIKESLGIGSFAPVIGEIKKLLEEIIYFFKDLEEIIVERENLWTFYSQYPIPEVKVVEWKSFPGKANNICKLVGLIETTSVGEFKEFLKADIHNVKGVFAKRDFKMTCINFLSANKSYRHYQWEGNRNRVIMEIVYCRLPKN